MAPDQHVQLRHRFDKIITDARTAAIGQDEQEVQSLHLDTLSAEEQIRTLIGKKHAVQQQAQGLEKKEYYRLDRYDHLMGILYLSRLICLGQDDEQAIREGIRLNVKEQHIDLLLAKAKEQFSAFTLDDFLADRPNMVFYELNEKPAATSNEDYENILTWQTNQKISCIKLEFNRFRDNFKKEVKDEIIIQDSLQDEIKICRSIIKDAPRWKAAQFREALQQLKALSGISLPDNIPEMHQAFGRFLQGNNPKDQLSPRFFKTALSTIEAGKISPMPVFGFSLLMYFRWLQHVSACKIMAFQRMESSFDNLFDIIFNEIQHKKEQTLHPIKKKAMDPAFDERHYENFILRGMEEQRKLFNKLKYPHYFTFMEQREILKNSFIEDCLRSLDIGWCKEALKQSILLHETIQFFGEELRLLRHDPLTPSMDMLSEISVMTETLCHMAPGSELINLFLDTRELIKKQVYNDRVPLFLICENLKDLFTEIFEKAVKNFNCLVENLLLDEKGLFISELLHEINYMETINGIKCRQKNIFFKQFKHLLKNELKIVHEMQSFKHPECNDIISKTDPPDNTAFSFGYHPGPKELKTIMDALQLKINIFKDPADVDAFIQVFTCEDLSKFSKPFKLGCQTNQFKSVMDFLEDYSTNFNPASIEKSGLFISKKGKPITANCLTASNTDSMKAKYAIQNIFKGKH